MIRVLQTHALPLGYVAVPIYDSKYPPRCQDLSQEICSDSIGNRTRVTAVKGRCLNRLTMGPYDAERISALLFNKTGNVLFSRAASRQVSSALGSLTSVFEMGTGGSSPPLSPDFLLVFFAHRCVALRRSDAHILRYAPLRPPSCALR